MTRLPKGIEALANQKSNPRTRIQGRIDRYRRWIATGAPIPKEELEAWIKEDQEDIEELSIFSSTCLPGGTNHNL